MTTTQTATQYDTAAQRVAGDVMKGACLPSSLSDDMLHRVIACVEAARMQWAVVVETRPFARSVAERHVARRARAYAILSSERSRREALAA